MSGVLYERSMNSKIASLRLKLETAERSIKTALEAHNSDPTTNGTYKYYTSEIEKIPERRETAITVLERKRNNINAEKETLIQRKEAEIEALRALISRNDEAIEKEKESLYARYESQVKDNSAKANAIVETMAEPATPAYQRNKALVLNLKAEIRQLQDDLNNRLDEEDERRRKRMREEAVIRENARLQAEREEKQLALEAWERSQAAQREADRQRQDARDKYLREHPEEDKHPWD